eukprot:gb/GECG01016374.1/.p1 GENE.gb/GECG01016374.1/~~gb/GECG01016374.1/.p1  ORF type:complete len:495 (+),score=65.46 gb/GECG01016374.1/:1-1485(+)
MRRLQKIRPHLFKYRSLVAIPTSLQSRIRPHRTMTSYSTGHSLMDTVVSQKDGMVKPVYRRFPARIGQSIQDVDTPTLLLDLDDVDYNIHECIRRIQDYPDVQIRPHVKTHKCPELAKRQIQLSRGRTTGVCCQKVIEAEAMVWGGVKDVFISNEVVGRSKLERIVRLATDHDAHVRVVVDNSENVAELSKVIQEMASGRSIDAVVEMDVGQKRCGVATPKDAVELAKTIHSASGLNLKGIQAYHGAAQHIRAYEDRVKTIDQVVRKTKEAIRLFKEAGLPCDVVTGGGTGTYPLEASSGIFTEVQPGSYVVNDADYSRNLGTDGKQLWGRVEQGGWKYSLLLYATVMSRNVQGGYVVLDLGLKATSIDSGPPVLKDEAEALTQDPAAADADGALGVLRFGQLTDEHATVLVNTGSARFHSAKEQIKNSRGQTDTELLEDLSWFSENNLPALGEKVQLVPGHCDPCCNHHDFFAVHRNGEILDVWEISGRSPGY